MSIICLEINDFPMENKFMKELYLKVDCTVCRNSGCYCPYCSQGKEYIEAAKKQIVEIIKKREDYQEIINDLQK